MTARDIRLLRASLALVWLATALASALEAHGRSAALLQAAGIASPAWAAAALWGGVALDALVGLLLSFAPQRLAVGTALAATLLMTAVATLVLPGQWLDPLGSLTKNLPIAALLLVLRRHAS